MSEPTDEEIVAAIRPILAMDAQRDRHAEVAERLRWATDPDEIAERDRNGERMAEMDTEICHASLAALSGLGLRHAASMIEDALGAHEAEKAGGLAGTAKARDDSSSRAFVHVRISSGSGRACTGPRPGCPGRRPGRRTARSA